MIFHLADDGKKTRVSFTKKRNTSTESLKDGMKLAQWLLDNVSSTQYDGLLIGISRYHGEQLTHDINVTKAIYKKEIADADAKID